MNLGVSTEQQELRESVHRFLAERAPLTKVRELMETAGLVDELGLAPAHIAGNSFGAAIVLRAATRRPEGFRTLIAHEPPLFPLLAGTVLLLLARSLLARRRARVPRRWPRLPDSGSATSYFFFLVRSAMVWFCTPE